MFKNGQLIPAVSYLRKSTKGVQFDRHGKKKQKQEKSLAQQKDEILKLAQGRFDILEWFEDEGIPGWKHGAKRPHFTRMLGEVEGLGAHAILCDDLSRFSRAAVAEVQEDANALHRAGVRWIVTANGREYDLGAKYNIGAIIEFVAAVWANCEYSRNLGRKISLARRNAAFEHKRSGGQAPYAMANDGNGGLKPGDPKQVKVVQWLFDQFVYHHRSLNWLAGDLNRRKVPGPEGGQWWIKAIGQLLRRRCYRGDFSFNEKHYGQFYGIDAKGEVVEAEQLNGQGHVFTKEGVYTAIVDPKTFDKAQERLNLRKDEPSRRKRMGYPLTGILVCDHCGGPMYGCRQKRAHGRYSPTFYRCGTYQEKGKGTCGQWQVREAAILRFVLRTLAQEIDKQCGKLDALFAEPPDELIYPHKKRAAQREQALADRERVAKKLDNAMLACMESADKRTRQDWDARITALRDELAKLDTELAAEPPPVNGYTRADILALRDWQRKFEATALSVPTPGGRMDLMEMFHKDPFRGPESDEPSILADPRTVNEMLHEMRAEVRLRWASKPNNKAPVKAKGQRHTLEKVRFRIGQQKGKLPLLSIGTSGVALPIGWMNARCRKKLSSAAMARSWV